MYDPHLLHTEVKEGLLMESLGLTPFDEFYSSPFDAEFGDLRGISLSMSPMLG